MKKIISIFIALLLLCTAVCAAEVFSFTESIPIAEGVTLTNVKSFYSDHNISYSYIKADLSNPNVGLKLLTPYSGADKLDTVGNLAVSYPGTVAALNADFFSTVSGSKALSLGIEIQDGKMLTSPINPDTMATVYEKDGVVDMGYPGFNVMVVAPNWQYAPIAHINKHTTYYGSILMYTSDFNGGYSPAPGGEVLEVVVDNGQITEFRRNMPSVKIPENGCVFVVSEGSTMFFANNFAVGDQVKLDYYVTPDILSSDTAFGGGAMLVSDGVPVKSFSHVISGYHPRSAVGIDESGQTLYLVAVNGRTTESRGMSMSELASLMASLGCYKAVNLDGGGSTNMVASTVWAEKIHTVNTPSENRRVVNAVGLTYSAEKGAPYAISLEADDNSVFIGQSTNISSAVYDENKRPVSGEITWSATNGTMTGSTFTGNAQGQATITATCEGATGTLNVYVIDEIAGIESTPSYSLSVGEKASVPLTVYDYLGHRAKVTNYSPFSFSSSDSSVAYVENGTLYAVGNGSTVISIEKNGAVYNAAVTVGYTPYEFYDGFEELSGSFSSYPAYVGGDWSVTDELAHSGSSSGMLYYDFTAETSDTKAAYYTLNEPVMLSDSEDTVTVRVKLPSDYSHSLKALFTDGTNDALYLPLIRQEDGDGFVSFTATVPSSAKRPVSLSRLYAVALAGEAADEGVIYFDDLSFTAATRPEQPFVPMNSYNDPAEAEGDGKSFRVGAIENNGTLLSIIGEKSMKKSLQAASAFAVLGENMPSAVNKAGEFYTLQDENALYISVSAKNGGIRKTSSSQWDSLINALNSCTSKNIFILSDSNLFSSDEFENQTITALFSSYCKNNSKSIFVIQKGSENAMSIIDGVHYFTVCGINSSRSAATNIATYSYLEFHLGSNVTYSRKTVW